MMQKLGMLWLLGVYAALMPAADKPIAIAHRGGAALRPENTIPAFQNALRLGVPVLEFDMNLTADNEIVVHHDSVVNEKICQPVAGSNVKAAPIRLLALKQIREFDCGSFSRPNSPEYQAAPGQRMPTLDEFLGSMKGSKAVLLGETKMPPSDAQASVSPEAFVKKIEAAIRKHKVADRFILQSGDYRTLDVMRTLDPKIQLCVLNARRFKPAYLDTARKHHATHIMLRWDDATPGQIKELKAAGLKLFSGTSNDPSEWPKYVKLGFDAILSDDPQALMKFLASVQ